MGLKREHDFRSHGTGPDHRLFQKRFNAFAFVVDGAHFQPLILFAFPQHKIGNASARLGEHEKGTVVGGEFRQTREEQIFLWHNVGL